VHHVPFAVLPGKGGEGVGSWLERAFLNTNHAKMYLAINRYVPIAISGFGLIRSKLIKLFLSSVALRSTEIDSCVMGKSNLYRKSDVCDLTPGHSPSSSSFLTLSLFFPFFSSPS
jgi:ceramide glucosyltransferase